MIGRSSVPLRPRDSTTTQLDASALILQNKGGGHGELGYQLAKVLTQKGNFDSITIVQDDACKKDKEPFRSYNDDLPSVKVIYAPIGDDTVMTSSDALKSIINAGTYDYIWDNVSKNGNAGIGKALIDYIATTPQQQQQLKLLCYVSSAGIYTPAKDHGRAPLEESTTPIKVSAGQHVYDEYAVSKNIPYVSFRPQYIYGPKSNKFDYM